MKWARKPLERLKGLTRAISRYPLTVLFLLAGTWSLALSIHGGGGYNGEIFSCAVGALLGACAQAAYERFFRRQSARWLLLGGAAVLTLGYYLLVRPAPEWGEEAAVRTWVTLTALLIAFIWLPAVRGGQLNFNRSFMAVFKSFFHSALYAVVLFGGCALIIAAVDALITDIGYRAYSYTADVVFMLFGPLFFFSLLPVYPGTGADGEEAEPEKRELRAEEVRRAVSCPGFLAALISYVMIPLAAVFTVILVLYIARNITGDFWTNNLLEPLLVSFAAVVLFLLILSAELENRFAALFRSIFPKVLVPIVAVQIAASLLSAREIGVTHPRYFVILFGIFAVLSGLILSILSVRKMGMAAVLFLLCATVAVIPPFDAFSVSRRSQQALLETALTRNGMLTDNAVRPKSDIPDEDKEKIIDSVEYLSRMRYTSKITWLPGEFEMYQDFYRTFGFQPYQTTNPQERFVYVALDSAVPIDISGYDSLIRTQLNKNGNEEPRVCVYERPEGTYILSKKSEDGTAALILTGPEGLELARFTADDMLARYGDYGTEKRQLSLEEALFRSGSEDVQMTVVVNSATLNDFGEDSGWRYYDADLYALIRFG